MEMTIGLTEALITIISLILGWGMKHFAAAIPNAYIPLVVAFAPPILAFASEQIAGIPIANPLMAGIMGALATSIHSGTKHLTQLL